MAIVTSLGIAEEDEDEDEEEAVERTTKTLYPSCSAWSIWRPRYSGETCFGAGWKELTGWGPAVGEVLSLVSP